MPSKSRQYQDEEDDLEMSSEKTPVAKVRWYHGMTSGHRKIIVGESQSCEMCVTLSFPNNC